MSGALLFICKSNKRKGKKSASVNTLCTIYVSVFKAVYAILPKQSFCLPCLRFTLLWNVSTWKNFPQTSFSKAKFEKWEI